MTKNSVGINWSKIANRRQTNEEKRTRGFVCFALGRKLTEGKKKITK